MDDAFAGRGRREKIPSAKIKEQVTGRNDKVEEEKRVTLPTYVAANDPKFFLDQKEISKSYDHTKILPSGEKVDFYTLSGTHVESKDRRYYIRAKRDPESFYFHACEAPPLFARLSDENHQQCAAEKTESCFTKDMLGKTGEFGSYTTRANVYVREGQFCWEARVVSSSDKGNEDPRISLAEMQSKDRSRTDRGGLRVGFVRREHSWSENLGSNAYSYAFVARGTGTSDYGNVRFNSEMFKVNGINPGNLKVGDVIGLRITLPPLEVHKKVVDGTFNPTEYPHLACGPANLKSKKSSTSKKGQKPNHKQRDSEPPSKSKDSKKQDNRSHPHQTNLAPLVGTNIPPALDILRDRNPFLHKGIVYFECPDYTQRPDLMRPMTRGKTLNPETGKPYQLDQDTHPNHELPHLRTLPGSKIEVWINGKYHGVVWENLFAFLPPASFIERSNKTTNLYGDVDDGHLGYYPAVSTFTGGAVQCKFDEPWWFGFDDAPEATGEGHPWARPIGHRYAEQIVEDFITDLVDEVYLEVGWQDPRWMRTQVLANSSVPPPPSSVGNTGSGLVNQVPSATNVSATTAAPTATNTGEDMVATAGVGITQPSAD